MIMNRHQFEDGLSRGYSIKSTILEWLYSYTDMIIHTDTVKCLRPMAFWYILWLSAVTWFVFPIGLAHEIYLIKWHKHG